MRSKKVIIAILVVVLLVVGLVAGVFVVNQQQEIRKSAAPATVVSVFPPTKTVGVGEEITLTVEMTTASNVVTQAALDIKFDPQKLTIRDFTPGTFLPVVLLPAQTNNTNGTAKITLGAQPANPAQGRGTLATLKFQAKTAGTATVAFAAGTQATGVDEAVNIITSQNPSNITVLAATAQTPSTGSAAAGVTTTPTPTTKALGGVASTTTPTPTSRFFASSTPTPTKAATKSATASAKLPVAGVSMPTIAASLFGIILIVVGFALAM